MKAIILLLFLSLISCSDKKATGAKDENPSPAPGSETPSPSGETPSPAPGSGTPSPAPSAPACNIQNYKDFIKKPGIHQCHLQGANLKDVDFYDANLQGANLQGADLRDANFTFAKLQGANLQGADLRDANFAFAKLQGANLRDVRFSRQTYFADVNLQGTDFRGANLALANLQGADFTGAIVTPDQATYLRTQNKTGFVIQ